MQNNSEDEQAIIAAIIEECEAFYQRDHEKWASYWLHHEDVRRLGTLAGGHVDYKPGWQVESDMMAQVMAKYPEPNYEAGALVRRENMMIRISGDMAWASFDQYTPRTDDVLVNVGLSHQIRVFERHDGQWKAVFAAHGDTRIEYHAFPTICVSSDGGIHWMNETARNGLANHPVLVQSANKLRARNRENDKRLRNAIAEMASLTPIDIRQSVSPGFGNQTAVALILEDPLQDAFHIVWVTWIDGSIVVSFDDERTTENRLDTARSIYNLSKAQMRLAALIVDGKDLGEAAEALGVTVNTVRTHLQRMFSKTKVHSQTALVRVLLSASAPAD